MLENELVQDLAGTWLVPARYLLVVRYMVGTCTRTVPEYWYGTVPYGTAEPVPYGTVLYRYTLMPRCRG